MRQQEAEQEAARRNAEDERRDRFVFYPLDHSAGMGADAWEVEMRLRTPDDGPMPAALAVGAGAPSAADPQPEPPAEPLPEPDSLPATQPFDALEAVEPPPPAEPPGPPVEPIETVEPIDPVAPAVRATELDADLPLRRRPRRSLRLIHVWAAFVLGVAPRRFLLGFLLAHVPMEGSRATRMTPLNQ